MNSAHNYMTKMICIHSSVSLYSMQIPYCYLMDYLMIEHEEMR